MRTIPVKTTYLEMTAAPAGRRMQAPMAGIEIVRVERPGVAFYRLLYDAVGRDWHWVDRKLLSDEELARVIHDERVEVYVLYVDHLPAGYAELDRRREPEIELAYLGIVPELVGRGLGRYLLDWILRRAWSYSPRRLWLHTCELDHEAALPLYLSAGFEVYDQRVIDQVAP